MVDVAAGAPLLLPATSSADRRKWVHLLDPCAVQIGSVALGIGAAVGYAQGMGIAGTSATLEVTLKLDVPFLPAVDIPFLKVPWW